MVGKRPPFIWIRERVWITPPVEKALMDGRRIGEPFREKPAQHVVHPQGGAAQVERDERQIVELARQIFGVDTEKVLIYALADETVDIESLVLPTDVANLSVLPAGQQRDGVTELLASARMRRIVDRLCDSRQRRMSSAR